MDSIIQYDRILGEGAYGKVYEKNGMAIKNYRKIEHITQEYAVLRYMRDSIYIVHSIRIDLLSKHLYMDLYDTSLRIWLNANKQNIHIPTQDIIIKCILSGLCELSDLGIVHGDIKPGNMLVRYHPFSVVIADCGLASTIGYAKTNSTALPYRDFSVGNALSHDMYSFGICLHEIVTRKKIGAKKNYVEVMDTVYAMENSRYKAIIFLLVQKDKDGRPTPKKVFAELYNNRWICKPSSEYIVEKSEKYTHIHSIIKLLAKKYNIHRAKRGYFALIHYISRHDIHENLYISYIYATLFILNSIFGYGKYDIYSLFQVNCPSVAESSTLLYNLLNDDPFIDMLYY